MSLFVASLNSGSNGNCYYVGTDQEGLLVDAGLSGKETEIRMKRMGLSLKKIKGIFITHEHSDHIYGVSTLSKRYSIPVYITEQTQREGRLKLKEHLVKSFAPYNEISIGTMIVTPIPKTHDAIDPHSFVVTNQSVKVGVFTDIGFACDHIVSQFKQCHAVFLESNYDVDLLEKGRYSISLKNRIRGGKGHLSNHQALELFINHRSPYLSHLFLSHLSEENNRQKLVKNLFNEVAGNVKIIIASRNKETPLYHVRHVEQKEFLNENYQQLNLF
jgi:phosphoribosyl 1,2-cyclic phosphodiesterase